MRVIDEWTRVFLNPLRAAFLHMGSYATGQGYALFVVFLLALILVGSVTFFWGARPPRS